MCCRVRQEEMARPFGRQEITGDLAMLLRSPLPSKAGDAYLSLPEEKAVHRREAYSHRRKDR